jgi:hypothetical protein
LIATIKRFDVYGKKVMRKMRYPASFNLKKHMDNAMSKDAED